MEVVVDENNLIDAIVSSIYILDYSSIYLAIARNVDPAPTPAIDILKNFNNSFGNIQLFASSKNRSNA
jgi:hypothetical protein